MVTAIRAFEKKSEFFKYDIQSEHNHFLRLPEQNKGKKRTWYVQFTKNFITNCRLRFDGFSKTVAITFWKHFLVTDITEFSTEAKEHPMGRRSKKSTEAN